MFEHALRLRFAQIEGLATSEMAQRCGPAPRLGTVGTESRRSLLSDQFRPSEQTGSRKTELRTANPPSPLLAASPCAERGFASIPKSLFDFDPPTAIQADGIASMSGGSTIEVAKATPIIPGNVCGYVHLANLLALMKHRSAATLSGYPSTSITDGAAIRTSRFGLVVVRANRPQRSIRHIAHVA